MAFIVSSLLYRNQVESLLQENLIASGKKIIQTYEATPDADLEPFMNSLAGLSNYRIQIYDREGNPLVTSRERPNEGAFEVSKLFVDRVLAGDIVRNEKSERHFLSVIGLPFRDDNKPYALFLTPETNRFAEEIQNVVRTVLIIVLFFGSLLILVAARYIVKPLQRLTEATRRMAKGKFDIELGTKRKDEIGMLTVSFNEMAKELAKLDQMRRNFVTNVSHEIQSPLTSITGFTKALRQKQMSEQSRLHYLSIIEEESERLSRLSQDLLHLSSMQTERSPLKAGRYRLDEQLRSVIIALEPQWAVKELDVELESEAVVIMADEDRLYQVWTNLLGNSIKFTPAQGWLRIRVETHIPEQRLTVIVEDNGIGIPESESGDIFKPFHKVDKSRDRSVNGNGLGLAIVKQIVDAHGGNIQVSGREGEGAIFVVALPLQYAESEN